jgi:hypothetical protein
MTKARWTTQLKRATCCGGLCLAIMLVAAADQARAADDESYDENSIWNLDRRMMDGVMKGFFGFLSPNDPAINYRERSPLVLPPSRDLPPPATAAAADSPAWPVDRDVQRRREENVRRRAGGVGYDPVEATRSLRPSELEVGRGRSTEKTINGDPGGETLKPSQLGYTGGLFSFGFNQKPDTATFAGEPPRRSLIEPPTGYQTPSPDQPYGLAKETGFGPFKPSDPQLKGIQ